MNSDRKHPNEPELSVSEKILRVQDLWDEIAGSAEDLELTPEQREEAERRLQEHERDPRSHSTWEEVRRRLERER